MHLIVDATVHLDPAAVYFGLAPGVHLDPADVYCGLTPGVLLNLHTIRVVAGIAGSHSVGSHSVGSHSA